MAKIEEEIECDYCESKFEISYDEAKAYGKVEVCPFCSEQLNDDEPYIEEETEDEF